MALMIDTNKTEYKGEAIVWECLKKNLPDNAVVYFNREIEGRTYDFCVLLENMGVMIIEVKGWHSDQVTVLTPDHIELKGSEEYVASSPRKQAYGYQYKLRELFKTQCGITPLYFNMVCYPFINHDEFNHIRLDIVSPEKYTLLKEDISDPARLKKKIDMAYENEKNDYFEAMTEENIDKIRKYYEPGFNAEKPEILNTDIYYSKTRIWPMAVSESAVQEITEEYFSGTKEILFVGRRETFSSITISLLGQYHAHNIKPVKGDLEMLSDDEHVIAPEENKKVFRAFNIELYFVEDLDQLTEKSECIIEGQCSQEEGNILKKLAQKTTFNYQQYEIEHGTIQKNILVQAGAGTGKTYSMVSRLAFLCNKHDWPVRSLIDDVAFVTFTNDAASNMKTRIQKMFINYYVLTGNTKYLTYIEDTNIAQISTIHKFALSFLQKATLYTGLSTNFRISQNEFLRQQLYQHFFDQYIEKKTEEEPGFIRKFPAPLYEILKTLMNFADRLSAKSININDVKEEELGSSVTHSIDNFNDLVLQVIQPAEKEYEIIQFENDYLDLRRCLSFLRHTMKQIKGHIPFLRYRYLFIDEFQDTDNVQIEIFKELQQKMESDCKLFVVGDLKQSIYRFRGATISAFDQLVGNKGDVWKLYTLNTNYRTDRRLLELLDLKFKKWGADGYLKYEDGKDQLVSHVDLHNNPDMLLTCISVHGKDEDHFFDEVFSYIVKKRKEIEIELQGHHLSDNERTIAILTRNNWQIQKIFDEGKKRGIHVDTKAGGELYRLPSTIDFYRLILALCNPQEPVYLANLIHSDYIGLEMDYNRLHGMTQEEKRVELTRILNDYFLLQMHKSFRKIVMEAYEKPVMNVLNQIYRALMPWKNYSFHEEAQHEYIANYEYLIELIIRSCKMEKITLNVINHFLEVNVKTGQKEQAREIHEPSFSGVRIICTTVHKSKGLEYGSIILPYTDLDISDKKRKKLEVDWNNGKLSYFIRLSNGICEYNTYYDEEAEESESIQEETRVLYVALTRAIRDCTWFNNIDASPRISWGTLMED